MRKFHLSYLLLFCTFYLNAQESKKVLLIGIDGLRPDALVAANTPNLDQLIGNGFYDQYALNDDITISGPGWSAILCGVDSEKHLVEGNDFTINDYENFPSIFKHVESFDSDFHTVSICNWNPINDFIVQDDSDFKLNVNNDEEVSSQAASYLSVNDPDLMFLHFDEIDGAGHTFGFSPDVPEYIAAAEQVDQLIGPILSTIENRENYDDEDWLIIATTDHGGEGFSHGGTGFQHQNVFIIASGKNVETEIAPRDSIVYSDNATNCLGDSIELKFDGENDFVSISNNPIFDFGAFRDFTVECRLRSNTSGDYAIIGNKDWDSGSNAGFVFSFKYPSGPEWKINIGDGTNRVDINNGGEIADNEWHTIGASFDRDGLMKMFQNGNEFAEADISNLGDINTGQGLHFGTDFNQAYDFPGSIAEVRIWDGIVSPQTINEWYCKALDNSHPNYNDLLGYWKMNEGGNEVVVMDHSTNGNDGNINGATWYEQDSITEYIYDNTSRLVDIVPTIFDHLCIPIDPEWQLDGSSLIEICEVSSTTELSHEPVQIYPNPTSDELCIQKLLGDEQMEIIDLNGKVMKKFSSKTSHHVVSLNNLENGVYIIRSIHPQHSFAKKIIVQH